MAASLGALSGWWAKNFTTAVQPVQVQSVSTTAAPLDTAEGQSHLHVRDAACAGSGNIVLDVETAVHGLATFVHDVASYAGMYLTTGFAAASVEDFVKQHPAHSSSVAAIRAFSPVQLWIGSLTLSLMVLLDGYLALCCAWTALRSLWTLLTWPCRQGRRRRQPEQEAQAVATKPREMEEISDARKVSPRARRAPSREGADEGSGDDKVSATTAGDGKARSEVSNPASAEGDFTEKDPLVVPKEGTFSPVEIVVRRDLLNADGAGGHGEEDAATSAPVPVGAWIVIDNGSHSCKVGVAGEPVPRLLLTFEESPKDALGRVREGEVDYMTGVWRSAFSMLKIEPSQHPVLLIDKENGNLDCHRCRLNLNQAFGQSCSPNCARKILFEKLNVPCAGLFPTNTVALAMAQAELEDSSSGLLVDIGYANTVIVPFVERRLLLNAVRSEPIGGQHLAQAQEGCLESALHNAILACVMRMQPEQRRAVAGHILLAGGLAQLPGLLEQLQEKLNGSEAKVQDHHRTETSRELKRFPSMRLEQELHLTDQLKFQVHLHSKPLYASWLGGCKLVQGFHGNFDDPVSMWCARDRYVRNSY